MIGSKEQDLRLSEDDQSGSKRKVLAARDDADSEQVRTKYQRGLLDSADDNTLGSLENCRQNPSAQLAHLFRDTGHDFVQTANGDFTGLDDKSTEHSVCSDYGQFPDENEADRIGIDIGRHHNGSSSSPRDQLLHSFNKALRTCDSCPGLWSNLQAVLDTWQSTMDSTSVNTHHDYSDAAIRARMEEARKSAQLNANDELLAELEQQHGMSREFDVYRALRRDEQAITARADVSTALQRAHLQDGVAWKRVAYDPKTRWAYVTTAQARHVEKLLRDLLARKRREVLTGEQAQRSQVWLKQRVKVAVETRAVAERLHRGVLNRERAAPLEVAVKALYTRAKQQGKPRKIQWAEWLADEMELAAERAQTQGPCFTSAPAHVITEGVLWNALCGSDWLRGLQYISTVLDAVEQFLRQEHPGLFKE